MCVEVSTVVSCNSECGLRLVVTLSVGKLVLGLVVTLSVC